MDGGGAQLGSLVLCWWESGVSQLQMVMQAHGASGDGAKPSPAGSQHS
jgi:hypothetical protein